MQVFPYIPGIKDMQHVHVAGFRLDQVLKLLLTTPVQVRLSTDVKSKRPILPCTCSLQPHALCRTCLCLHGWSSPLVSLQSLLASSAAPHRREPPWRLQCGTESCCICVPAQYVIGWQFHVWAVRSLRHGAANMYVLISLGTNAAYIYSVFAMIYYRVGLSTPYRFASTQQATSPSLNCLRAGRVCTLGLHELRGCDVARHGTRLRQHIAMKCCRLHTDCSLGATCINSMGPGRKAQGRAGVSDASSSEYQGTVILRSSDFKSYPNAGTSEPGPGFHGGGLLRDVGAADHLHQPGPLSGSCRQGPHQPGALHNSHRSTPCTWTL